MPPTDPHPTHCDPAEWTGPDGKTPQPYPPPAPPVPPSSALSRWLERQSPVVRQLVAAVLGAVVATVLQWVEPVLRPPAPGLVQPQQDRLDAAVRRTEALAEALMLD